MIVNKNVTKIIDFSECKFSKRNGSYGGNAGTKEGIIYNNDKWLIKYPKKLKGLTNVDMDYSTAPLSEYIGSKIYKILGYDVHEVMLGEKNNKIVVACKDFCTDGKELQELRTIKNVHNEKLSQMLDETISSTSDSHKIEIDEVLVHLKYNPILKDISDLKDRFWDMMVIDCFIANNDRNNGNWGLLVDDSGYHLAPVFDNGSSFNNRASDNKLTKIMSNEKNFIGTEINQLTIYSKNEHVLTAKKLLSLWKEYPDLADALKRNYPLIKNNMDAIDKMIDSIPTSYKGLEVISDVRKEYYKESLNIRMEYLFKPLVKEIEKSEKQLTNDIADSFDGK